MDSAAVMSRGSEISNALVTTSRFVARSRNEFMELQVCGSMCRLPKRSTVKLCLSRLSVTDVDCESSARLNFRPSGLFLRLMKTKFMESRIVRLLAVTATACLFAALVWGDGSRSTVASGQTAPAFEEKTVEGKTLKFPDDYKGKVVLLDFWATWCGPCRKELPNVRAAYEQYHSKGFDIVGVSLDQAQQGPKLIKFTQDNNMSWPQVYDGQYWKSAVAVKYGVHAIPCPILVDGDTGMVLADGREALGQKLDAAIEKALAAKGKQ